jgi:hypothetical protein
MSFFNNLMDRSELRQTYKWGRGIAKAKLLVFYTLREAHSEKPLEEIYYLTLLNRTGYTEAIARDIVDMVKEGSEGKIKTFNSEGEIGTLEFNFLKDTVTFNLRNVIKSMLIHENLKNGNVFDTYAMIEADKAVDDIIPNHL